MKSSVFTFENVQLVLLLVFVSLIVLSRGQDELTMAAMEKQEQETLYSAIQGFVGNWWNGSDLYPDPCGWTPIQGVSCDLYGDFWYVTELKIGLVYDNSLRCNESAEFTHHLFKLKYLSTLSFFNCFLSAHQNPVRIPTSNWETFSNSLESLELRSNPGLIGSIPPTIGLLRGLQSLVLVENGLTGSIPLEIGNLVNLRRLVLSGNQLAGEIPANLGSLKQLLIFDSSRNNLSGSLHFTIGDLVSLLKLDLSNNSLEGEIPREIGRLKNLTLLDLGSNKFSGGLSHPLEEMLSLKEMVMSNNPIGGDLKNIQWERLQSLELLDFSNMGLTGNIPESLAEMRNIRFLGLRNNNLSGNPSIRLASLPNLGALYLNGNNLTGKLEFSESFYRRMRRRFGAWNNPNLCYKSDGLSSTGHVPFGVKPCQTEPTAYNDFENSKMNMENAQCVVSLGSSNIGFAGVWWVSLVYRTFTSFLWITLS